MDDRTGNEVVGLRIFFDLPGFGVGCNTPIKSTYEMYHGIVRHFACGIAYLKLRKSTIQKPALSLSHFHLNIDILHKRS